MNARDAALLELDAIHLPGWRGGAVRGRATRKFQGNIDPRDRALAEQIGVGVIKNLLLLQQLIGHHSGRSLKSIDELVQKILAIGLYQLRFLSRIPASAAVDQAVEQARRFGHPRAAGFVNAVLRNAIRNPDPPLPTDVELSHPPVLMRRLRELLGNDEVRVLQFARHDNREPPTIARLMPGTTINNLRETAGDSVDLVSHEREGMIAVHGAKRALLADWSRRGLAQVQDPTSASIVDHLDLRPGQRVLDRCAGLGTKTMQIVERVGPGGNVVAVDPNHRRMKGLKRMLEERGITNVSVREVAFLGSDRIDPFDRILVDAPCSNSGVLPRRPEARYAQDDRSVTSLRKLQLDILNDTLAHLAAGGLLVYSTCSVWSEENEDLIAFFRSFYPEILLLDQQSMLPSFETEAPESYHDGGYFAVLKRPD